MQGATLLLPTWRTATEYGRVKFTLKRAGVPLPENDIWIAATAIEHGLSIATRDGHFSAIPGLSVLDWR